MIKVEIEYVDFLKLPNRKIIDIRDEVDYNKQHLKDAVNVPFNSLLIYKEKYLDKKKNYLLVCSYGLKSKKTSEILNNNGYHTFSLKKGMKNI